MKEKIKCIETPCSSINQSDDMPRNCMKQSSLRASTKHKPNINNFILIYIYISVGQCDVLSPFARSVLPSSFEYGRCIETIFPCCRCGCRKNRSRSFCTLDFDLQQQEGGGRNGDVAKLDDPDTVAGLPPLFTRTHVASLVPASA